MSCVPFTLRHHSFTAESKKNPTCIDIELSVSVSFSPHYFPTFFSCTTRKVEFSLNLNARTGHGFCFLSVEGSSSDSQSIAVNWQSTSISCRDEQT